jgi:hypothetical protein
MKWKALALPCLVVSGLGAWGLYVFSTPSSPNPNPDPSATPRTSLSYRPRVEQDTGYGLAMRLLEPWRDPTSLEEIRDAFTDLARRNMPAADRLLLNPTLPPRARWQTLMYKACLHLYDGRPREAYKLIEQARTLMGSNRLMQEQMLYSIVYLQGVAALRLAENENCLECRGDSACIFPISQAAVHTKPEGSRLAIRHFTEYLDQFPDDPGVRWLLNLAYMTLGEHPAGAPEKYRLDFSKFGREADIGQFRDIGHLVGVNRLNQAGGAVMDDFDNDGLLDVVISSSDPTQAMAFYRNKGDGTFEDRSEAAGLTKQYGGLFLVQTDYNNDGFLDLYVPRGAWFRRPMRASLLRNNGNGTFTDVTREAGLMDPVNSINASWADYDNDGFLDLFVCNETGPSRLYRNKGDGTFEEVAAKAGVQGKNEKSKGSAWLDYDRDGYPDLFVNNFGGMPQLFHNNRDGTFTDVTAAMGIAGPKTGFSCWAFDYDNDGWPDILATCSEHTLDDVVRGMRGEALASGTGVTRLYRNLGGKKFQDISHEVGVAGVFATMGSNFADFDNDGYLDFYLATGSPSLDRLVPNRMFKNLGGKRFADITVTSRTGHLQKGHSVACGDWDRDGNVDMFVELGGALPGDRFHNALFQNPGRGGNWLTVKLVGNKTNRAAIGAQIKVVTSGKNPLTAHRVVSSGSSFGGNPLQQHIGLGKSGSVARVEVFWPTSRTTQVFRDVKADQALEVTEFAKEYRKLDWTKLVVPKE